MEHSSGKKFAPIYLFLVLFALLMGFLYYMSHRRGGATTEEFRQVNLKEMNPKKEAAWEQEKDLSRVVEVGGHMVQTLTDGTKIRYTLDPALQAWVLGEFNKYAIPYAAAVLIELPSGQVRVLAGHSAANPKLTNGELTLRPWAPAASLIKVVTAAALLKSGNVKPESTVCYHGGRKGLTPSHFVDDPAKDTQCEDLFSAMGNSTNAVFGKLGQRHLTRESYLEMAQRFGFNSTIPFDFPIQKSQIKISPTARFAMGYTSAGFGNATLSPIHAAWIMALIAGNGRAANLRVIGSVVSPSGENLAVSRRPSPKTTGKTQTAEQIIPASDAVQITAMLRKTVAEGTAREAFFSKNDTELLSFETVGKTGTLSRNKPEYLQYTWFAGFAPRQNPTVAFAVLVVNPLKWRTKATFMAQRMLLQYFKRKKLNQGK